MNKKKRKYEINKNMTTKNDVRMCEFLTKKGNRCKDPAAWGSRYCKEHQRIIAFLTGRD